jgi:hypothetical protein
MSRKTPVPVNPTPTDTRRSPPARPPLPRPASTPGGESPCPPGDPAGRETRRPSAPPERQPRAPGEPTHLSRRAEGRGACHLESLVYTATPRAGCGRSPSAITTSAAKRAGSGGTARAVLHSLRSFPGRAPPHSTSAAASPILPGRPCTDRDPVDDPPCVLPRPTSRILPHQCRDERRPRSASHVGRRRERGTRAGQTVPRFVSRSLTKRVLACGQGSQGQHTPPDRVRGRATASRGTRVDPRGGRAGSRDASRAPGAQTTRSRDPSPADLPRPPPRSCLLEKTAIPSPRRQQPVRQGSTASCGLHPVRVRPSRSQPLCSSNLPQGSGGGASPGERSGRPRGARSAGGISRPAGGAPPAAATGPPAGPRRAPRPLPPPPSPPPPAAARPASGRWDTGTDPRAPRRAPGRT